MTLSSTRNDLVMSDRGAADDTRLRVATVLSFPPGPRSGGPGTFVAGLADALGRNSDLDFQLIAPDHLRGGAGQRAAQLRFAVEQLLALRRLRPDVVHSHDHPVLLAAAVAYRMLSRTPVRVV